MNFTVDVVGIAVTTLIALVGFLLARTLTKIDKNQDLLFTKLDVVKEKLDTLQGEHESRSAQCQQVLDTVSLRAAERINQFEPVSASRKK